MGEISKTVKTRLSDVYQHFTVHEILFTLNFFASMALRFSSSAQIG